MRKFNITGMRVHQYSEFEWADLTSAKGWDSDKYVEEGVAEAKERKLRYFSVLVKPSDELLSEAKPENPHIIDTWRWDARVRAVEFVDEHGDTVPLHNTALLALLAKYVQATVQKEPDGTLRLFVPIPTVGLLQCVVPGRMAELFQLPKEEKFHQPAYWDTAKILEAVFMLDRKHG